MNKGPEGLRSCSDQWLACSGQCNFIDCEPKDGLPGLLRTVSSVPHFFHMGNWISTYDSRFSGQSSLEVAVILMVNVVTPRTVAAGLNQKIPLNPA